MLNLPPDRLRALLYACLAVDRWVDELMDAAPYASGDALLTRARQAATSLSTAEIGQALGHHPRIGEKPRGEGAAQVFSREEQSFVEAEDADVAAAIAQGNADYEQRFERVFLIRARGRTRSDILAELRRRLQLDEVTELAIVGSELADIALLRLRASLAEFPVDPTVEAIR